MRYSDAYALTLDNFTGCDGELHAPPARSTSASNSSRTCPPHRVVSFESHGAGAAGAHARGRRARRLSVRNLSTIDQKTPASVGTLPYALHLVLDPRVDLSDLLPICPPSVDLRVKPPRAAAAAARGAGAAGWRRGRRQRSTGRPCAGGGGLRRRSGGARRFRTRREQNVLCSVHFANFGMFVDVVLRVRLCFG